MIARTLARYALGGTIGAAALWVLTVLVTFALSPEMGTP